MSERISTAVKVPEAKSQTPVSHIQRNTDSSQSINSPIDRILFLQRTIGNQAVTGLIKSGALQAKLRIVQPGDIYEQEAERVAEQMMGVPDISWHVGDTRIQRKCPKCREDKRLLARSFDGESSQEKKSAPPSKSAKKSSTKGATRQEECGKKCGGTELGSVECDLNLETGLPTNKVRKEVRAKDPCISPCVDAHETVHVKDIQPVCNQVHKCLSKASGDIKKQNKCLDTYEADYWAKVAGSTGTECAAYKAEEQCMKKQEFMPECKTKEGQSLWAAHLSRTKCYKDCYCSK